MRATVNSASRLIVFFFLASLVSTPAVAQPAPAVPADEGAWHVLEVSGGAVALSALGIQESLERAAVMTALIRRLHFSPESAAQLSASLVDLRNAAGDLDALRNAIAIASPAGQGPALAMAAVKKSRNQLQDVLEAAGLELKQSQKQYRVELRNNDTAAALRKRLALVGVDADGLRKILNGGGMVSLEIPKTMLPLPLSPQVWSKVVFERDVPARRLFIEILTDPSARLLYHGLAGMDSATRRWMATEPGLIRRIYGDAEAVRAFALFGPSIRVSGGKVAVPGEPIAERRWTSLLGVSTAKPDQFVRRLLDHNAGRSAGLYFTIAAVAAPRRKFLLGANESGEGANQRFERLVSSFANCYPSQATLYPFALRSHDAALMLLEIGITDSGNLAGPVWRRFWQRVLDGESLPDDPVGALRSLEDDGAVDAAWLVDTLCGSNAEQRGSVFVTILAGHRVFAGAADVELADVLVALRARRLYPAVFMALEHARVTKPQTYAAIARHASKLARLDDRERSITALRQFQGALSLTLNAITAGTFAASGDTLLHSLAEIPFEDERYGGRLAGWLVQRWLPALRPTSPSTPVEALVALALAGPGDAEPRLVRWEGQDYVVDIAGAEMRRLQEVRKRQGGVTLDTVLDLHRISSALRRTDVTVDIVRTLRADLQGLAPQLRGIVSADEYATDGPKIDDAIADAIKELGGVDAPRELKRAAGTGAGLLRSIDFLLAHVLGSWAYAPHIGDADSGALIGGDASLHHVLGVAGVPSDKFQQRWELTVSAGSSRAIKGSLLGLQAALANWSLRRLSSDTVPPPPTIGGNDLASFLLTASISDPRRLDSAELAAIARSLAAGAEIIRKAATDSDRLAVVGEAAAMSPWRREVLGWIMAHEPARLADQFSITQRARLGGLTADDARDWGSASIVTGCLCLQMPPDRIPEVIVGRAADGLLGGQSADLMLRVAEILAELEMPAALASTVLSYAMRDFLDHVKPVHSADFDAFGRQASALNRRMVEDYLGAIAAVGPLRPAGGQ